MFTEEEESKLNNVYSLDLPSKDFRCELIKLLFQNPSKFRKVKQSRKKVIVKTEEEEDREIRIANLLKKFKNFQNFLEKNSIPDEALLNLVKYIKLEKVEANKYLFQQNDFSDKYYIIIKGNVSLRTHQIIMEKNERSIDLSNYKEINILTDGMIIGETEIIYDMPRSESAYTLDDVYLVSIRKEKFKGTFSKYVLLSEFEKRLFLKKCIPYLNEIPSRKFNEFYGSTILMKFYKRNQVIYNDNNNTGLLYLIYKGECSLFVNKKSHYKSVLSSSLNTEEIDYLKLWKNLHDIYQEKSQENNKKLEGNIKMDLTEDHYELNEEINDSLISLSKGGIGGLEICAGLTKMKFTCVAKSQKVSVMVVNLLKCSYEEFCILLQRLLISFIDMEIILEKKYFDIKSSTKKLNGFKNEVDEFKEDFLKQKLSYIAHLKYDNNFFELDNAGFIVQDSEKNNQILKDMTLATKIENKVDHNLVKLSKDNKYKNQLSSINKRIVKDRNTLKLLDKISSNLTDDKTKKLVNTCLCKPKEIDNDKIKLLSKLLKRNESCMNISHITNIPKTTINYEIKKIQSIEKYKKTQEEQEKKSAREYNKKSFIYIRKKIMCDLPENDNSKRSILNNSGLHFMNSFKNNLLKFSSSVSTDKNLNKGKASQSRNINGLPTLKPLQFKKLNNDNNNNSETPTTFDFNSGSFLLPFVTLKIPKRDKTVE